MTLQGIRNNKSSNHSGSCSTHKTLNMPPAWVEGVRIGIVGKQQNRSVPASLKPPHPPVGGDQNKNGVMLQLQQIAAS